MNITELAMYQLLVPIKVERHTQKSPYAARALKT